MLSTRVAERAPVAHIVRATPTPAPAAVADAVLAAGNGHAPLRARAAGRRARLLGRRQVPPCDL